MKLKNGEINISLKIQYTHVPKTAGSSIRKTLNRNNIDTGKTDHTVFSDTNYFKLTSIRNPYDRFVSAYYFLLNMGVSKRDKPISEHIKQNYTNFSDFSINFHNDEIIRSCTHIKPQVYWTGSDLGKFNHIIRYENLQKDWEDLCKKLNKSCVLLHEKISKHEPYYKLYDSCSINSVYNFYKDDFDLLKYNPTLQ